MVDLWYFWVIVIDCSIFKFDVSFFGKEIAGFGLGPTDYVWIEDGVRIVKKLPAFGLLLGTVRELTTLIKAFIFSSRTVQSSIPLEFQRREEVFVEMQI